ncbi:SDR family NAD(P)-dependent oxidoreductase [Natronosporangium hydrolyticum]|uniref:SDR family NAD(P)-dependent oxidoreductase n=1 Tax=Natronosporangium hydrolyticum TaxID=2811111 RepID=A0A895YDM0_9ACTN|nr:SDR family NAD(P)-dependent oxidoreductase [Natronosporangium hydrolyticum]QSB15877.1 SDR family NAD(P)-dependent oxidoreductase [Natronosporangium hydrolyticum]
MRVSFVTGVSRGLGAALLDELFAAGDRVVGIGRSFTDEQRALPADRVLLREADLARPETLPEQAELSELLAGAESARLIHNAAVVTPIGAVGDLSATELATAVTVNLTAPMVLTNAFLGALPATTPATILFISSGAAHRIVDGWATYGATKRGGEEFFQAVAAQVAGRPVRVANANPGVMDTDMQAAIRAAASGDHWFPDQARFLDLHARGELPDPAQVARRLLDEHG